MATHVTDRITWFLELDRAHTDWLAPIRHWRHLSVATEADKIWVSGFEDHEVNSIAIRSIPVKDVWYKQGGAQLFRQGSILPSRNVPSLLWSPIERGLPLEIPAQNHNYFGMNDQVAVKLVVVNGERPAAAMVVTLQTLKTFIETAPAIRLRPLQWTILNNRDALIVGTPLLPIPGESYWQDGNFLLPAGYDFEWPALRETIRKAVVEEDTAFALWQIDAQHVRLSKRVFKPLTIGSFRQSETLWTLKTTTT